MYTHVKQGNRNEDDRRLLLKILALIYAKLEEIDMHVTEISYFCISVVQIFRQRNYDDFFVFKD